LDIPEWPKGKEVGKVVKKGQRVGASRIGFSKRVVKLQLEGNGKKDGILILIPRTNYRSKIFRRKETMLLHKVFSKMKECLVTYDRLGEIQVITCCRCLLQSVKIKDRCTRQKDKYDETVGSFLS
jgi:hypothetical protein